MTAPFARQRADASIARARLRFHLRRQGATRAMPGDTLASALLANGVHLVGRSFKYHRPRGHPGAGSEEPNALVGVDARCGALHAQSARHRRSNSTTACVAESQNRWPSLAFDIGGDQRPAVAVSFRPASTTRPSCGRRAAWKRSTSRTSARRPGLGKAPTRCRSGSLCAALRPLRRAGRRRRPRRARRRARRGGRAGARVMLCDEQAELGGSLLAETGRDASTGEPARPSGSPRRSRELSACRVSRCCRAPPAFGYFAHNFIGLSERLTDHLPTPDPERAARAAVAGARAAKWCWRPARMERPLVFPDNDRPGIMLAGAARTYLQRAMASRPGARVVVVTAHDAAYRAALDLAAAGLRSRGDRRSARRRPTARSPHAARAAGTAGLRRSRRRRHRGRLRVSQALAASALAGGRAGQGPSAIACDRPADVGRLYAERASLFAIARQAGIRRSDRGLSCPANPPNVSAPPAPAAAFSALARLWPTAIAPANGGAGGRLRRCVRPRASRSRRLRLAAAASLGAVAA